MGPRDFVTDFTAEYPAFSRATYFRSLALHCHGTRCGPIFRARIFTVEFAGFCLCRREKHCKKEGPMGARSNRSKTVRTAPRPGPQEGRHSIFLPIHGDESGVHHLPAAFVISLLRPRPLSLSSKDVLCDVRSPISEPRPDYLQATLEA